MLFERVAILGVGLIGGSFALALKQAQACAHVVGAGRNPPNLKPALESGAGAANAELFRDKRVILTPLSENSDSTIKKIQEAWSACGARISRMDPDEHDAVLAAVSHLPHVLAYALVHELASRADAPRLFEYAAGGFRDFTRIASSHPEMWRDICIANRDRLLAELKNYTRKLSSVQKLLDAG